MANEKLLKKYNKIYNKINNIYKYKKNLYDSCKKLGISHTTYYRICKTLNKEGIREKLKEDVQVLEGGNLREECLHSLCEKDKLPVLPLINNINLVVSELTPENNEINKVDIVPKKKNIKIIDNPQVERNNKKDKIILSTNNINTNHEQSDDTTEDKYGAIRYELGKTAEAVENASINKCKNIKKLQGRSRNK
jgi:hypothetical protein